MDLLIDEFLDVLEKEAAIYISLLSILKDENEAIVESRLEKLNEANSEKKMIILKIQNLEAQRLMMLERLVDSLGCADRNITLKTLSRFTEEPYSSRLKDSRSKLFSLMEKVQEANERNRSLLTHSIELIRGSMALLNNLISSNTVYYSSGEIQSTDRNGRVFSGEI